MPVRAVSFEACKPTNEIPDGGLMFLGHVTDGSIIEDVWLEEDEGKFYLVKQGPVDVPRCLPASPVIKDANEWWAAAMQLYEER